MTEQMGYFKYQNTVLYGYPAAARCDYIFTHHFVSLFSKHKDRRVNETYSFL